MVRDRPRPAQPRLVRRRETEHRLGIILSAGTERLSTIVLSTLTLVTPGDQSGMSLCFSNVCEHSISACLVGRSVGK